MSQPFFDEAKEISGLDDGEHPPPVMGDVLLKRRDAADVCFHHNNLEHFRTTGMGQFRPFALPHRDVCFGSKADLELAGA